MSELNQYADLTFENGIFIRVTAGEGKVGYYAKVTYLKGIEVHIKCPKDGVSHYEFLTMNEVTNLMRDLFNKKIVYLKNQ